MRSVVLSSARRYRKPNEEYRYWCTNNKKRGDVVNEESSFWFDESDVGDDIRLVNEGSYFLTAFLQSE